MEYRRLDSGELKVVRIAGAGPTPAGVTVVTEGKPLYEALMCAVKGEVVQMEMGSGEPIDLEVTGVTQVQGLRG